jgi:hypothetical protein
VGCVGIFLWFTVCHCSSIAVCVLCVDGYPVFFGGAAFVVSLPFFSVFRAAALACAGFVRSTYLSKISSSVSGSSSMVGIGVGGVVLEAVPTCAVGVCCCPYDVALFTCNWLRKRAHVVAPSMSSRFFSLFLKPSTDRNREWTDGVRSFVSPWILALCLAPIAAWSYFSSAVIWAVSFFISAVGASAGWVSHESNCSTISSTPHRRSTTMSTLLWISSSLVIISDVSTTYFDLVVL